MQGAARRAQQHRLQSTAHINTEQRVPRCRTPVLCPCSTHPYNAPAIPYTTSVASIVTRAANDPTLYLAVETAYSGASHIRNTPPVGPCSSICLGSYGGPRGGAFSYERGTPVCRNAKGKTRNQVVSPEGQDQISVLTVLSC